MIIIGQFKRHLEVQKMAVDQIYLKQPKSRLDKTIEISHNPPREKENQPPLESFASMYNQFVGKIYRYIYFRVADEKTAEDLTSQVFMKAWEGLDHFQPTGAQFITWLYTIAHNTIIDYYRTHKQTITLETSIRLPSEGLTPEEESESDLEKEVLHHAIQCLTAEQQNVVILKYINGMTTEEIASHLGKKTGTIRALQMRALQSLCKRMTGNI
jgi:RNA polymerase sigma factor (sigma-70 family)